MHLNIVGDNPLESLVLKTNLVADPLVKTQMAFTMARAIMAAVEIDLFEALAAEPKTSLQVSQICKTQVKPTTALLNSMVSCGYLSCSPSRDHLPKYALTASAQKWLLRSSPHSICDKMLFQIKEWDFLAELVPHLREGTHLSLHTDRTEQEWKSYQKAMVDIGRLALNEVVKRIPIPKEARTMLDIGGSGGTYSAAFVKSRKHLSSLILDLPDAVKHSEELIKSHGLTKDRLDIKMGNALEYEFGTDRYDFIFLANVAHHLSEDQNRVLAQKSAMALKPKGVYCILEPNRTEVPSAKNQFGCLLDLYFGLTSQSGTWTLSEMGSWISNSGLEPGKPIKLRSAPGVVMVFGTKL